MAHWNVDLVALEWLLWDADLCQIMSELKQEMERSQSLGYIEIIGWYIF